MIKAVIFDMDGLLIDSEPLWAKAEIKVFEKLGIRLSLEMTQQTTGLRTDEVVEYYHKRHPWKTPTQREIAQEIDETVIELITKQGRAMEGIDTAIQACESLGLPMAIASSSSLKLISAVVEKLKIGNKMRVIHSAHNETFGKPHPAVYITTAEKLGVHPTNCLAFEDSANGVLAAKAAKMQCIAIPEPSARNDKRFGIADMVLHSLKDFSAEMLENW